MMYYDSLQFLSVACTYTFEVRAHTYSNRYHYDYRGRCCDHWWRRRNCRKPCDNRFNFCLRSYGASRNNNANDCPLGARRTAKVYENDDYFNFPSPMGGVPNPMSFSGSSWPVSTTAMVKYVKVSTVLRMIRERIK